jgi:hypothetical protein
MRLLGNGPTAFFCGAARKLGVTSSFQGGATPFFD